MLHTDLLGDLGTLGQEVLCGGFETRDILVTGPAVVMVGLNQERFFLVDAREGTFLVLVLISQAGGGVEFGLVLVFVREAEKRLGEGELGLNFLDGDIVVHEGQKPRVLSSIHQLFCDLLFAVVII